MAKTKTQTTQANVLDFINSFTNTEQKRQDSVDLVQLMQQTTGFEPKMWGPTIIGFGNYHYKYPSGHQGDAPIAGFSPRKAAISLYVFTGLEEHKHLLDGLGKFKIGKACIYINQLSDINRQQLIVIIQQTIAYLKEKYPEN
jgi:hypothetical protein